LKSILLSLLLLVAGGLGAADLSGKWSGTVDVKEDGQSRTVSALLVLKQDGKTLTGTAGGEENDRLHIRKGTVEGNAVTLEVQGEDAVFYVDLTVDGDQMNGNARRGESGEKMKLSLKRVKE
jgi:hypothetical protein